MANNDGFIQEWDPATGQMVTTKITDLNELFTGDTTSESLPRTDASKLVSELAAALAAGVAEPTGHAQRRPAHHPHHPAHQQSLFRGGAIPATVPWTGRQQQQQQQQTPSSSSQPASSAREMKERQRRRKQQQQQQQQGGGGGGPATFGARPLSEQGKAKLRYFVVHATSTDELAELEDVLNGGPVTEKIAKTLSLVESDFQGPPPPEAPKPQKPKRKAPPEQGKGLHKSTPVAGLILTQSGLQKVRTGIAMAHSETILGILEQALTMGDIVTLQAMLDLQPEDVRQEKPAEDSSDEEEEDEEEEEVVAEAAPQEGLSPVTEDEEEYDPFSSLPERPKAAAPPTKRKRSTAPKAEGTLGSLQGTYGEAEASAAPPKKKAKKQFAWPVAWAWLMSRTMQHENWRAPEFAQGQVFAKEPDEDDSDDEGPSVFALATSLIYVGDQDKGYDPKHLGRVALVDSFGGVIVDCLVKPRQEILDCRTHLTGLTREMLTGPLAVDFDEAQRQILRFLKPTSLLAGYFVTGDLEALNMFHRPLIDVAHIFEVDSRKKHQHHSLRWMSEQLLGKAIDEHEPYDAVETAQLVMKLATYEASRPTSTPKFEPPKERPTELLVKHIPYHWGDRASGLLNVLCPGAAQNPVVRWRLNDSDPTDWRGEAVLVYPSQELRDIAFQKRPALTDVYVFWEDVPGAPPLGALFTESSMMRAFSEFGTVVNVRIPRKGATREPQSFAFVSFLSKDDAAEASRSKVSIEITPTWKAPVKARLAKFGHTTDKRVAIEPDPERESEFLYDWVHIVKR